MSPTQSETGSKQSQMTRQSRDREKVVPECSRREIFRIFLGKIWFPGNGIRERIPLSTTQFSTIFFNFSTPYIMLQAHLNHTPYALVLGFRTWVLLGVEQLGCVGV